MVNWQAIAAIASAVAAIVASFIAYLNYRARPLAVRAVELHSLKFQGVMLPDWKNCIPKCPDIFKYYIGEYSFHDEALRRIETSQLFKDLPNHLPPGNSLMLLWKKYQEEWETLERSRGTFARKVRYFIDQTVRDMGLHVGSEKHRNVVIEYHFVQRYYNAILEMCQGRGGPYSSLVSDVSNLRLEGAEDRYGLWVSGGAWVFAVGNQAMADQSKELLVRLVNELPTTKLRNESIPLLDEAVQLCAQAEKVGKLREQIEFEIDNLIALPLLPNPHCPFLKVVEAPLMPRWLMKLISWFSHPGGKNGISN